MHYLIICVGNSPHKTMHEYSKEEESESIKQEPQKLQKRGSAVCRERYIEHRSEGTWPETTEGREARLVRHRERYLESVGVKIPDLKQLKQGKQGLHSPQTCFACS